MASWWSSSNLRPRYSPRFFSFDIAVLLPSPTEHVRSCARKRHAKWKDSTNRRETAQNHGTGPSPPGKPSHTIRKMRGISESSHRQRAGARVEGRSGNAFRHHPYRYQRPPPESCWSSPGRQIRASGIRGIRHLREREPGILTRHRASSISAFAMPRAFGVEIQGKIGDIHTKDFSGHVLETGP